MSSIRTERVALDSNEFIFAFRQEPRYSSCGVLVFERIDSLHLYVPRQVMIEVQRNVTAIEMQRYTRILTKVAVAEIDYAPPPPELFELYESRGAKKGDAIIAAHLHSPV